MQENKASMPIIKDYIRQNMPNGGYQMVSKRLESKDIQVSGQSIMNEIRTLKNNYDIAMIKECLLFMKDVCIELDIHCQNFLKDD